jgi:hypothetical protein
VRRHPAARVIEHNRRHGASETDSGDHRRQTPPEERSITTMRTTRALILSLFAVFAISAVTSASASAAPGFWVCREGGTEEYENHLCQTKVAGGKWSFQKVEGAEVYKFTDVSGETKFESKLLGVRIIIVCKKDTSTGELEKEGKTKNVVLIFAECSLFEVKKHVKTALGACIVPNIKTEPLKDQLIVGKGIGPEDEFEPEAGTTFAKIKVEGCALASNEAVTGKQICALPEGPVGKVAHEVVCSPSGGELKFGTQAASFYGAATITLENGWSWAAE